MEKILKIKVAFVCFTSILTGCSDPVDEYRHSEKEKIKACWAEQSKKSLTPGAARVLAEICEGFESDFRKKFGVSP